MKTKNFEEGFNKLEDILAEMQKTDTSLEQSIELYKEAKKNLAFCKSCLELAYEEISVLVSE